MSTRGEAERMRASTISFLFSVLGRNTEGRKKVDPDMFFNDFMTYLEVVSMALCSFIKPCYLAH